MTENVNVPEVGTGTWVNRWAAFTNDELDWIDQALDFDDETRTCSLRDEIDAELERRKP